MAGATGTKVMQAYNIHCGGGKVLLESLLHELQHDPALQIYVDARYPIAEMMPPGRMVRVKPALIERLKVEWKLHKTLGTNDTVLCFGNLPPLFPLRARTVLFLQNRLLVDRVEWCQFPWKQKLKLLCERLWLALRIRQVSRVVVQTAAMQTVLQQRFKELPPVTVLAFVPLQYVAVDTVVKVLSQTTPIEHFIYVSSGAAHKNHAQLFAAWQQLAAAGIHPQLHVTLDARYDQLLLAQIEELNRSHGTRITNHGQLTHEKVLKLYAQMQALIFPSTHESLGLPLVEAKQCGLTILASEKDYVRELLDPEFTFDPESATSIARAVKRCLGIASTHAVLQSPRAFLDEVFGPCAS